MTKKSRNPESFLHRPEYPGGAKALNAFVAQQLVYPEIPKEEQIEGVVKIRLDIDYKGRVIRTKILQGLGPLFDAEADRVVRLLKFTVEHNRNLKVTFHKTLNITFRPPAPPQPAQTGLNLNYSVSKSHPDPNPPKSGSKRGYSYSIPLKSKP
ncbi:MAG: TonB family protein [Bacteroidia bacterium]|nr:TonB family protein [Bacteroidia bacterium]